MSIVYSFVMRRLAWKPCCHFQCSCTVATRCHVENRCKPPCTPNNEENESSFDGECLNPFHVVSKVDPFAKSRILQYLKRLPVHMGEGKETKLEFACVEDGRPATVLNTPSIARPLVVRALQPLFIATFTIPLCDPDRPQLTIDAIATSRRNRTATCAVAEGKDILVAVGLSDTSKGDAEAASAMHAELLLDATNRCLYCVPSSQKRYALQRGAEGRTAPVHAADGTPPTPAFDVCVLKLPKPVAHITRLVARPSTTVTTTVLPRRPVANEVQNSDIKGPSSEKVPDSTRHMSTPKPPPRLNTQIDGKRRPAIASIPPMGSRCSDETEGGLFQLCTTATSRPPTEPFVLLTPCIIDRRSLMRIEDWIGHLCPIGGRPIESKAVGFPHFSQHIHVEENIVSSVIKRGKIVGNREMVKCSMPIGTMMAESLATAFDAPENSLLGAFPSPHREHLVSLRNALQRINLRDVVATGKATTLDTAIALCAMHCELLLSYFHFPMFLSDVTLSSRHWDVGKGFGRREQWRDDEGGIGKLPLPLKELHPTMNDHKYRSFRTAKLSPDEKLLCFHANSFNHSKTIIVTNSDDFCIPGFEVAGTTEAEKALADFQAALGMRRLFFVSTFFGGEYRTSLILHNLTRALSLLPSHSNCSRLSTEIGDVVFEEDILQSTGHKRGGSSSMLPVAAMGCAPTQDAARILCVAHALDIINAVNLPLFINDPVRQRGYSQLRLQRGLHTPTVDQFGNFPSERLLIRYKGRDNNGHKESYYEPSFSPLMAMAPSPSYCHGAARKKGNIVTTRELNFCLRLHSKTDFSVFDDELIKAFNVFYRPLLEKYLYATQPTFAGLSAAFASVEEDRGSNWRHRSTAWLRFRVKASSHEEELDAVAVGRATRLHDAESACIFHLVLLLIDQFEVSLFDFASPGQSRKESFEQHVALLRQAGYADKHVIEPFLLRRGSTLFRKTPIDSSQTSKFVEGMRICPSCPPVICKSTYDSIFGVEARAKVYDEMRTAIVATLDHLKCQQECH